jgi:hypothetical protein
MIITQHIITQPPRSVAPTMSASVYSAPATYVSNSFFNTTRDSIQPRSRTTDTLPGIKYNALNVLKAQTRAPNMDQVVTQGVFQGIASQGLVVNKCWFWRPEHRPKARNAPWSVNCHKYLAPKSDDSRVYMSCENETAWQLVDSPYSTFRSASATNLMTVFTAVNDIPIDRIPNMKVAGVVKNSSQANDIGGTAMAKDLDNAGSVGAAGSQVTINTNPSQTQKPGASLYLNYWPSIVIDRMDPDHVKPGVPLLDRDFQKYLSKTMTIDNTNFNVCLNDIRGVVHDLYEFSPLTFHNELLDALSMNASVAEQMVPLWNFSELYGLWYATQKDPTRKENYKLLCDKITLFESEDAKFVDRHSLLNVGDPYSLMTWNHPFNPRAGETDILTDPDFDDLKPQDTLMTTGIVVKTNAMNLKVMELLASHITAYNEATKKCYLGMCTFQALPGQQLPVFVAC